MKSFKQFLRETPVEVGNDVVSAIRANVAASLKLPLEDVRVGQVKGRTGPIISIGITLDADSLLPDMAVLHKVRYVLDSIPGFFFRKDFNGIVPRSNGERVVWVQFTALEE